MSRFLRAACLAWVVLIPLASGCSHSEKNLKDGLRITYSSEQGIKPEKLWPDPALKSAFERYWGLRKVNRLKEAFLMEAPYFQKMVSEAGYARYAKVREGVEWVEVKIDGIERKSEHLVAVDCRLYLKGSGRGRDRVYLSDEWVNMGDEWFHVTRHSLFFPDAS